MRTTTTIRILAGSKVVAVIAIGLCLLSTIDIAIATAIDATGIIANKSTNTNKQEQSHSIPTFSFSDLRRISDHNYNYNNNYNSNNGNKNEGRLEEFRQILATTGLLAIRLGDDIDDIDGSDNKNPNLHPHQYEQYEQYSADRGVALDGLCSCIDHPGFLDLDQTHELALFGGSTLRTSVATATVGVDHPLPLPKGLEETCGDQVVEAMEGLRDAVSSVSEAFVSALDRAIADGVGDDPSYTSSYSYSSNSNGNGNGKHSAPLLRDQNGQSYKSINEILRSANHLEHFHVYTQHRHKTSNGSGEQEKDGSENENENENNDREGTSKNVNNKNNNVAWDWHTDAGLFLVFVPAWDCNNNNNNHVDESFYYRDGFDGTPIRAGFDGGRTAIVMLGQGAQDWLDLPKPKQPRRQRQQPLSLKATSHSVRWSDDSNNDYDYDYDYDNTQQSSQQQLSVQRRRAWYGMMHLVPETAMIHGAKTLRDVKRSLSLSHQSKNKYEPSSSSSSSSLMQPSSNDGISLGCGNVNTPVSLSPSNQKFLVRGEETSDHRGRQRQRQRHLQMLDAFICNNVTNFFCWMTCMDIPEFEQAHLYVDAGYSLYCVDEGIMASTNNDVSKAHESCLGVHNAGCTGVWEKSVEGVEAAAINVTADRNEIEHPFCYGGTTMYMEGFQWVQSSTCVVMLVPSWVLNSASKYAAAVIGTILMAMGLEKFIQQRRKTMACMESGPQRLVVSAVFYGVQLSIGYLLMLVIMIYSGLLFLAVIVGLVIGHVMFNAKDAIWPINKSPNLDDIVTEVDGGENKKNNLDQGIPEASTPCCQHGL